MSKFTLGKSVVVITHSEKSWMQFHFSFIYIFKNPKSNVIRGQFLRLAMFYIFHILILIGRSTLAKHL